jgi:hypothetical protein
MLSTRFRFGSKADSLQIVLYVCFTRESGHSRLGAGTIYEYTSQFYEVTLNTKERHAREGLQ